MNIIPRQKPGIIILSRERGEGDIVNVVFKIPVGDDGDFVIMHRLSGHGPFEGPIRDVLQELMNKEEDEDEEEGTMEMDERMKEVFLGMDEEIRDVFSAIISGETISEGDTGGFFPNLN